MEPLGTQLSGNMLVFVFVVFWKSIEIMENYREIIGNIFENVRSCSGHFYGTYVQIVGLKAPGNYSASIWINKISILSTSPSIWINKISVVFGPPRGSQKDPKIHGPS